ncbi:MAG: hypothetical protein H8E66_06360 [Planctomycetes bacterium]|nr:hypothetical protein [Planctomycetota bacterium]
MQFRLLKSLLLVVLAISIVLSVYRVAPTLCLSVLLLGPLPLYLVFRSWIKRSLVREKFTARTAVVTVASMAFYLGSLGPVTALAVAPESWRLARLQAAIAEPTAIIFIPAELVTRVPLIGPLLSTYQAGWIALTKVH